MAEISDFIIFPTKSLLTSIFDLDGTADTFKTIVQTCEDTVCLLLSGTRGHDLANNERGSKQRSRENGVERESLREEVEDGRDKARERRPRLRRTTT